MPRLPLPVQCRIFIYLKYCKIRIAHRRRGTRSCPTRAEPSRTRRCAIDQIHIRYHPFSARDIVRPNRRIWIVVVAGYIEYAHAIFIEPAPLHRARQIQCKCNTRSPASSRDRTRAVIPDTSHRIIDSGHARGDYTAFLEPMLALGWIRAIVSPRIYNCEPILNLPEPFDCGIRIYRKCDGCIASRTDRTCSKISDTMSSSARAE